ncbi:rab-GTPase-TBC domain-containing protein, partial [Gilbertella persicaria]|uniref:rab-GTPase-TBC domain-containing protein n=1 Tax=Gilbertella persicaria TaxID=101096 RepID=UPI00221EB652
MKRKQRQRKRVKKSSNKPAHENDEYKSTFKINQALKTENYALLREIGREEGFRSDAIRRRVWPFLLHCTDKEVDKVIEGSLETPHKDESQVKLDVIRSFHTFSTSILEEDKERLQDQLSKVITHVLRSYPSLHYYQGFHDICSVFILLFGEKYASKLMEPVALFYLRYEMFMNMDPVLKQLTILDTFIQLEDKELHAFISEAGVLPYYCLSWVLTWCSHDLDSLEKLTRLFDLFLCSNPLMPLYFAAAVVLSRKKEILALPCDVSILHSFLTKLPKDLDAQTLCQEACVLEERYPVYDIQCKSQIALDQESTVNCFEKDWIPIDNLQDLNNTIQQKVIPILQTQERKPIELVTLKEISSSVNVLDKLRQLDTKDIALYTLFTVGAGVGLVAIFMTNAELLREWLTSGV